MAIAGLTLFPEVPDDEHALQVEFAWMPSKLMSPQNFSSGPQQEFDAILNRVVDEGWVEQSNSQKNERLGLTFCAVEQKKKISDGHKATFVGFHSPLDILSSDYLSIPLEKCYFPSLSRNETLILPTDLRWYHQKRKS
ncbi:hypothetical protein OUZ56_007329 [Daphnia magna]|uniref:Uncharacterized protein n=1 Tax=Daphnia magna TaxID=35525 RepID=A0ABQ9YY96_9CRUS|nr:hypothetical protein OUZ56_007329 [Daphnia magna]